WQANYRNLTPAKFAGKPHARQGALAVSAPAVHARGGTTLGGPMTDQLPRDGLVAVVKRDCPTCVLTAPVLGDLARNNGLTVYTQDDPSFPETVPGRVDDTALGISHGLKIEIVPTLIRFEAGREVDRTYGWDRGEWQRLTGVAELG